MLCSYHSFGATQQQQQDQSAFAAASSTYAQAPTQMQMQSGGRSSRITPLYQGVAAAGAGAGTQRASGTSRRSRSTARASPGQAQSERPRARTPLPAPPRAADLFHRQGAGGDVTARMSKSATFGSPARADAPPQYLKGQTGRRAYAYAHLPPVSTPVFDPMLPSPTVVVHGSAARSLGFNKSVQERKHRGTSRNTSGGFYTS